MVSSSLQISTSISAHTTSRSHSSRVKYRLLSSGEKQGLEDDSVRIFCVKGAPSDARYETKAVRASSADADTDSLELISSSCHSQRLRVPTFFISWSHYKIPLDSHHGKSAAHTSSRPDVCNLAMVSSNGLIIPPVQATSASVFFGLCFSLL